MRQIDLLIEGMTGRSCVTHLREGRRDAFMLRGLKNAPTTRLLNTTKDWR